MSELSPEQLAEKFHEAYERLAHKYGYRTREKTSVPWKDVPMANKSLMIAVCEELVDHLITRAPLQKGGTAGDEVVRDAARYRQIRKGLSEHYGDVYGMVFDPEGDYPASWNDLDKHGDAALAADVEVGE